MDERAFFDQLADIWDENEVLSTPEKVREILGYMNIKPGQSVLDLGTGTGVLLPILAKLVGEKGEITAVDFSSEMLKIAKKKNENLIPKPSLLNLDIENENILGEYDHIILYCVYPHLHTPIETLKWLEKVNLKKDGLISIAFPCGPDFINKIHEERHAESENLPSAEKLAEFFNQNGLDAEAVANSQSSYVVNIKKSV